MARRQAVLAVLAITLVLGLVPVAGGASRQASAPGSYIVMLEEGTDPVVHAHKKGVTVEHTYRKVFRGYSAQLSVDLVEALRRDAEVKSIHASVMLHPNRAGATLAPAAKQQPQPQRMSVSLRRVGLASSPTAKVDSIDERVDVDVAILDGGIQPDHPDLNVVGGTNCLQGQATDWKDRDGHGTLVGGIIGGVDNNIGRVGIAPGARLWAVRISPTKPGIPDAALICGLEWVVASGIDIEVVNLSLAGEIESTLDDCDSDPANWHPIQHAICAVIRAGVTVVASAGNEGIDAVRMIPAAIPDVVAVSAFAETDGLPGGLGPTSGELGCEVDIADDSFTFFSNFGSVIDLSAPGVCVASTYLNSTYSGATGTSYSAPIVSGAAALYLANHPSADPETVRDALIRQREKGPIAGDPDGIDEGIVDVSRL